MTTIPEPFKSIQSVKDAHDAIVKIVAVNTDFTTTPSFMTSAIDIQQYVRRATSPPFETKFEAAKMVNDILRNAAPVVLQVYGMSEKFLTASKKNMDLVCGPLLKIYDKYIPARSRCRDFEELQLYRGCVDAWRANMEGLLPSDMGTQMDAVTKTLHIGHRISGVASMIEHIEEQKNSRIRKEAKHLPGVIRALNADVPIFSFDPSERRAVLSPVAFIMEDGEPVQKLDYPQLLLTTAILADEQSKNPTVLRRIEKIMVALGTSTGEYEMKLLECFGLARKEAAVSGGVFNQEGSNIDQLFLAHFIVFGLLKLTVPQFYVFQRVMYVVGRQLSIQEPVRCALMRFRNFSGITELISKLSKSTEMYLPPWVINAERFYDVVGIFGACDVFNFKETIKHPAVSLRYIHNINNASTYVIEFITSLNFIERYKNETGMSNNCFYQSESEYIFRQLLLCRKNNFMNTFHVTVSASSVNVIE